MSAPAPNLGGQERQNRKILEQLEEQKKRLRTQTSAQPLPKEFPVVNHSATPQILTSSIDIQMTQAQRTAIQHAHANSVGYFTTQDSAFGNLILPVLPRFDK